MCCNNNCFSAPRIHATDIPLQQLREPTCSQSNGTVPPRLQLPSLHLVHQPSAAPARASADPQSPLHPRPQSTRPRTDSKPAQLASYMNTPCKLSWQLNSLPPNCLVPPLRLCCFNTSTAALHAHHQSVCLSDCVLSSFSQFPGHSFPLPPCSLFACATDANPGIPLVCFACSLLCLLVALLASDHGALGGEQGFLPARPDFAEPVL